MLEWATNQLTPKAPYKPDPKGYVPIHIRGEVDLCLVQPSERAGVTVTRHPP